MKPLLKAAGAIVVVSIVLRSQGIGGELLNSLIILVLLVSLVAWMVAGSRPIYGDTDRTARKASFFSRYANPAARGLPKALLVGLAVAEISTFFGLTSASTLAFGIFVAVALAFPGADCIVSAGLGGLGAGVVVGSTFGFGRCVDPAAGITNWALLVAVVIPLGAAFTIRLIVALGGPLARTITGLLGVPARVRRTGCDFLLLAFGLLEIGGFLARPAGMEIWLNASPAFRLVFFVALIVLGVIGSYAPEFVMGILAVTILVVSVFFQWQLSVFEMGACAVASQWISVVLVVTPCAAFGIAVRKTSLSSGG